MRASRLPFLLSFGLLACRVVGDAALNPITAGPSPDPTVWRAEDGTWYSTSTALKLLTSADGVRWTETGRKILPESELKRVHASYRWIWAPDVVKLPDGPRPVETTGPTGGVAPGGATVPAGRWRLYVSYVNSARDSAIAAYRGESATGPFTFAGILTDARKTGIKDTIDPEVVRDPDTGKTWLFYGSTGRVHRLQLADDGLAPMRGAKPILVGGLSDEGVPNRQQVFEGTYLHRRDGWWYLFASRGWYKGHTYGVVVARSRTLEGAFVDRDGRPFERGFATVILSSGPKDRFFGPGHNGEIFTDAEGRDWMYFHCHVKGPDSEKRPMFRQELFWGPDGWPYFGNNGKPSSQAESSSGPVVPTDRPSPATEKQP